MPKRSSISARRKSIQENRFILALKDAVKKNKKKSLR